MQRRLLAIGALLGALLLTLPAAAGAAACQRINENQVHTLGGSLTEDRYSESYSGGGQPHTANHKITQFSMGTLTIRATTCLSRGRWRVLNPVVLSPDYANMKSDGSVPFGATSWGLAPLRVRDRSLSIRGVWCQSSHFWKGAKGILGVPLPTSFTFALGQYIAAQAGVQFLPDDKTSCDEIVPLLVRFQFSARGVLKMRAVGGSRNYLVSDLGDIKIKKDWRVSARQR